MQIDEEGFAYPKIDKTSCIACDCCHKACPVEFPVISYVPQVGYVGYNTETTVRAKSASGGAFKAIIDTFDSDAIVFGVKWKNRSTAVHSWASKKKHMSNLLDQSTYRVR